MSSTYDTLLALFFTILLLSALLACDALIWANLYPSL